MSEQLPDGVILLCDICHQAQVHHHERGTQAVLRAAVNAKATALGWSVDADGAACPSCVKQRLN